MEEKERTAELSAERSQTGKPVAPQHRRNANGRRPNNRRPSQNRTPNAEQNGVQKQETVSTPAPEKGKTREAGQPRTNQASVQPSGQTRKTAQNRRGPTEENKAPVQPRHTNKNVQKPAQTRADRSEPSSEANRPTQPMQSRPQPRPQPLALEKGEADTEIKQGIFGQRREKGRKNSQKARQKVQAPAPTLRIIPLGGLNEIGKNMTAIECGDDILVIDCGMGFPDEDMPGVDLVIPDITYLEQNVSRVRGIFLTHGHEDHIGAIPYVLRTINPPIYGTRLTLGIIRNKLEEHSLPNEPKLCEVRAGDTVKAGCMSVEFIHVNHSIADACALAVRTPQGMILHTGDFKLDTSPIDGDVMDLTRLGELGREGVRLLLCESTNAERPGFTPSERKVGESLEYIFTKHPDKRLIIATFSSNVHRVQQIIDISVRHNRRVVITGRSMTNIVGAAVELGYMNVPKDVLIDIADIKRFRPEELTIVTTGSQGEPMSALYRMAYSDHAQITLTPGDLVVLSASAIPGNEKLVGRVINELTRNQVPVMHESALAVHVSGHACQEELKLMQVLTKPQYFMPVHGEYRHLAANRDLALYMGMDSRNIFITEIGQILEINGEGARISTETVPSGRVLVDGYGVGDVGNIVLRDRLHLSQDGLIVVVATLDEESMNLLSGPDIISRGFVYVRESEELMEEARRVVNDAILDCRTKDGERLDRVAMKKRIKDDLTRFLYNKTKRKPMILPVIMNV